MSFLKEYLKHKREIIKLCSFRSKWRKHNKHNLTIANTIFDENIVKVSKGTYGHLNIHSYNKEVESLIIGNYCSIAGGVHFILSGGHSYETLSTYPFDAFLTKQAESISKGPIIVDDDVWIGFGSIILSGVHIGKGAIIGAGSVVTKNVEPYSIVAGTPARLIKYRFSKNIIEKLLDFDFSNLNCNSLVGSVPISHYEEIELNNYLESIQKRKENENKN